MYQDMSAYLSVSALATGAALTVGLLTFSGMFAMLPSVPMSLAAMFLAVGYEGEVYVQNIHGAWDKLFSPQHHERMIAKLFLLNYTPDKSTVRPQFFEELLNALELLELYEDTQNPQYEQEILDLKDQIDLMEEYFTGRLFNHKDLTHQSHMYSTHKKALTTWLKGPQTAYLLPKPTAPEDLTKAAAALLKSEKYAFAVFQCLSAVASIAMILGNSYLLVEALTELPAFAFLPAPMWPLCIIPLSIIAGVAYGFLTYNALTDMWHNRTVQIWRDKLHQAWVTDRTFSTIMASIGVVLLLCLSVILTICTAGTWWTIVQETPPLFLWMRAVPVLIFQLVLATLIGAASLIFNAQNTMETLEFFYEKLPKLTEKILINTLNLPSQLFNRMLQDNPVQAINPFRLIRLLIAEPLRYLLFIGHLVSESLGSTRLPGVPDTWSTAFGFVSNFFQDFLYFFNDDESHEHTEAQLLNEHFGSEGHEHSDDLPTQFLKAVFSPILNAEIMWDFYTSKLNVLPLNLDQAQARSGILRPQEILSAKVTELNVTLFKPNATNYIESKSRHLHSINCQHLYQVTQMSLG